MVRPESLGRQDYLRMAFKTLGYFLNNGIFPLVITHFDTFTTWHQEDWHEPGGL